MHFDPSQILGEHERPGAKDCPTPLMSALVVSCLYRAVHVFNVNSVWDGYHVSSNHYFNDLSFSFSLQACKNLIKLLDDSQPRE